MTSTAGDNAAGVGTSVVDVSRLETLGREVISGMQSLRELLAARSAALEECRDALVEYHTELARESEQLDQRERELCDRYEHREKELGAREDRCAAQEAQLAETAKLLESKPAELRRQRAELDARVEQANAREIELDQRGASLVEQERRAATAAQDLKEQSSRLNDEREHLAALELKLNEVSSQLDARRAQLDRGQETLAAAEAALAQEREELSRALADIEARKVELENLSSALDGQRAEVESQQTQLRLSQQEYELNMRELASAQDNLATLQEQLETELKALAAQKSDLLRSYGLTEDGASSGAPADGQLPRAGEHKSRESLKRFQKLCRDAKRKAIGAG